MARQPEKGTQAESARRTVRGISRPGAAALKRQLAAKRSRSQRRYLQRVAQLL